MQLHMLELHFVALCGDVAGEYSIIGGVTNARGHQGWREDHNY